MFEPANTKSDASLSSLQNNVPSGGSSGCHAVWLPGVDASEEPKLLIQPWDGAACPCGASMLDVSLTCTDGYSLLKLSSCADPSADAARWLKLHPFLSQQCLF